jgi:hypothetical protein
MYIIISKPLPMSESVRPIVQSLGSSWLIVPVIYKGVSHKIVCRELGDAGLAELKLTMEEKSKMTNEHQKIVQYISSRRALEWVDDYDGESTILYRNNRKELPKGDKKEEDEHTLDLISQGHA